ncbi:aspartic peptidase domain-containing protein [Aspergillus candidus]|uniref:Aspartic peptidase domain-containing protein n=1 Tax=Aspergillus candidus TaxID=41067 RepID=A0A2I2F8B2_ASPCN|nr:aspartic peptidase domain-containing protein [Aspergillus candidus]PLB36870.1 aspartic peptidase domain-containing protein [Aspergillus candidus]
MTVRTLGLALLALAHQAAADCEGSNVITLPYRNVTVNGLTQQRGLEISLGTPPQALAFDMAGYANNTFLWDWHEGCGASLDDPCILNRGGVFMTDPSTSWTDTASPNITAHDSPSDAFDFVGVPPRGADTLHINDTYALYDFPVATTTRAMTFNSLGLGPDSTFLQYLSEKGAILSKSWGLFFGLNGYTKPAQMNGVAVFGGYDKAKTQGDSQTFDVNFESDCPTGLDAFVTSVDVGMPNGTEYNALSKGRYMCIDPSNRLMTFDADTIKSMKSSFGGKYFGNSTGLRPNGLLYDVEEPVFGGNITITLNTELKITITNEQLVTTDSYVSEDKLGFSDTSREILVGYTDGQANENTWYLGQPFLTAAYLLVNHDESKFHVWQNKVTDDEEYHAVQPSGTECKSEAAAPDAAKQTTSPDEGEKPSKKESGGLSGGAIAGIVVGVVVGVALVAGAIGFILYRRKQQAGNAVTSPENPPAYVPGSSGGGNGVAMSELAAKEVAAPAELEDKDRRVEVPAEPVAVEAPAEVNPVYEMPAEVPGARRGS